MKCFCGEGWSSGATAGRCTQCAENGVRVGRIKWRVVRQVMLNHNCKRICKPLRRSNLHSKPPATKGLEKWRVARQVEG